MGARNGSQEFRQDVFDLGPGPVKSPVKKRRTVAARWEASLNFPGKDLNGR